MKIAVSLASTKISLSSDEEPLLAILKATNRNVNKGRNSRELYGQARKLSRTLRSIKSMLMPTLKKFTLDKEEGFELNSDTGSHDVYGDLMFSLIKAKGGSLECSISISIEGNFKGSLNILAQVGKVKFKFQCNASDERSKPFKSLVKFLSTTIEDSKAILLKRGAKVDPSVLAKKVKKDLSIKTNLLDLVADLKLIPYKNSKVDIEYGIASILVQPVDSTYVATKLKKKGWAMSKSMAFVKRHRGTVYYFTKGHSTLGLYAEVNGCRVLNYRED